MKAGSLKPGDAIEVRLDMASPWRAAKYERRSSTGASWHRVELDTPVYRDTMTGYVCDESSPRAWLGTLAIVPASRIRRPGVR